MTPPPPLQSPYAANSDAFYAGCDKTKTSVIKVDDVSDVLEEAASKLANSLLLFAKVTTLGLAAQTSSAYYNKTPPADVKSNGLDATQCRHQLAWLCVLESQSKEIASIDRISHAFSMTYKKSVYKKQNWKI